MTNIIVFLCLFLSYSDSNRHLVEDYIETYRDLAIIEMNRTGIPASIKLGQAILESSYGTSTFARASNNHFGIKCKQSWSGKKYQHKDDDLDSDGKLIHSCFRAYEAVIDSYVDHSNFLSNRPRYSPLFSHPDQSYRQWAISLSKYGYATDPAYSDKLIRIIERYQLFVYDK